MELRPLLQAVLDIARESGKLILEIYQAGEFEQEIKSNNTPVTSADLAAHALIKKRLKALTPDIPVLSEEDTSISFQEREKWDLYWLIDPLDGTQEFISQSGDFATIIALVEKNKPVMGVAYFPVIDAIYYAMKGQGAWKQNTDSKPSRLSVLKRNKSTQDLSIAISRRQDVKSITDKFASNWHYNLVPCGSAALKSCLVAEGAVDCYLRLGPTGEWDTAATQCIVEESGGRIVDLTCSPLSYNERDSLVNPNFIVMGDLQLPWKDIVHFEQP